MFNFFQVQRLHTVDSLFNVLSICTKYASKSISSSSTSGCLTPLLVLHVWFPWPYPLIILGPDSERSWSTFWELSSWLFSTSFCSDELSACSLQNKQYFSQSISNSKMHLAGQEQVRDNKAQGQEFLSNCWGTCHHTCHHHDYIQKNEKNHQKDFAASTCPSNTFQPYHHHHPRGVQVHLWPIIYWQQINLKSKSR